MNDILPTGDLFAMSFASLFLMFVWFGYPLLTLFQCWIDKERSTGKKIGWSVFIIVTWLFYAIGAIIYGLVTYKKLYKMVPVAIIILVGVSSIKMINSAMNISNQASVVLVKTEVEDPQIQEQLLADLKVLSDEGGTINSLISSYLLFLVSDNLTDEDFDKWRGVYERRANLTEQDFKQMQDAVNNTQFTEALEKVKK